MALPDPTHYYALDEVSGTATAADTGATGGVDLSSVTGTPTSINPGKDGRARGLGGDKAVAQAADASTNLCGPDRDVTIAFWLKYDVFALAPASGVGVFERTGELRVRPATSGDSTSVDLYNGSFYQTGTSLSGLGDNNWHLVVIRQEGGATRRFRARADNGTDSDSGTLSGAISWAAGAATNRLQLGEAAGTAANTFAIDAVMIDSRAAGGGVWSDAELTELWNSGAGKFWDGSAWQGAGGGGGFTAQAAGWYYRMAHTGVVSV